MPNVPTPFQRWSNPANALPTKTTKVKIRFRNLICIFKKYLVGLICDLQEDMTGEILGRVTSSLACTTIDTLIVNLNNNSVFSSNIIDVKCLKVCFLVEDGPQCCEFWTARCWVSSYCECEPGGGEHWCRGLWFRHQIVSVYHRRKCWQRRGSDLRELFLRTETSANCTAW